jgi:hypothetical protein
MSTKHFDAMTRSHLQVLQPFLAGFGATLFFGCAAMGAEKYGHVRVPVHVSV